MRLTPHPIARHRGGKQGSIIKPFMKSIPHLAALILLGIVSLLPARAVVKDAAVLQGSTLADGSAYLTSATPVSIVWDEKVNVDPSAFTLSTENPSQLMVRKDGDHLVAVTMPVISINTADNRPSQGLEVYVNGEPAAGTVGTSGYIRNQPRNANMQQETSCHVHALLPGLSSGDIIEVRAYKTAQAALETAIQTASLYVELVPASRPVFAALSDGPGSGTNLNPNFDEDGDDPAELAWTSIRKDSGFTHSNGSSGIDLSSGTYLLTVNVPMQSTVQRASVGMEILLGNNIFPIPGGTARQGYIRNASGHNRASIHWAGIISVSGTQTLLLQTLRVAQAGEVIIENGKQASIYLERLDEDGLLSLAFSGIDDAGNPFEYNTVGKTAIPWDQEHLVDSGTYNPGNDSVEVREDGHYLLVYQDTLWSQAARPNPRITVEVNGEAIAGAETKSHYIRNANGHNESSGTLVFLLDYLESGDTITVSTQREGQTGSVTIDEFSDVTSLLALIGKESIDPGTIQSPPVVRSFNGNRSGWEAVIQNYAVTVVEDSVSATVDGMPATVRTATEGSTTRITWEFDSVPDSGSTHDVALAFDDSEGGSHQKLISFTITDQYVKIPPSFTIGGIDRDAPGFTARITQISTTQSGAGHVHGNNIAGAERQLAGEYTNADGEQYLNEAASENATGWVIEDRILEGVINLNQVDGNVGNFGSDQPIPGIPGFNDLNDGIAAEFLTHLELEAGFHTLGVNSDDGFEVGFAPALGDLETVVAGFFNSSRGAADTLFDIHVEEAGVYPVRLLWYEGTGGANVEFFSVTGSGEKVLINDPDHAEAIRAWRTADSRPALVRVSPLGSVLAQRVEYEVRDGTVSVDPDSVTLVMDGTSLSPDVNQSGGTTTIGHTWPDGGYFPPGERTIMLSWTETGSDPATRTYRHVFLVPRGQIEVLKDAPFAYWRFSETSGIVADNEMSDLHNGSYRNDPGLGAPRLVVGDSSPSVSLEAAQQHWIQVPNHHDINNMSGNLGWTGKTIEFWFKARSLPSAADAVDGVDLSERMVLYEQGGATRGMNIYLEGTQEGDNPQEADLWFNVLNRAETAWGGTVPYNEDQGFNPNDEAVAVNTTIEVDTLYHAVFLFEGDSEADSFEGGVSGWLNGEHFGTVQGANLLRNHTDGIGIGRRNSEVSFHDFIVNNGNAPEVFTSPQQFYFDGWIDEFALYNHMLAEERILAHYQAGLTEVPVDPSGGGAISIVDNGDGTITLHYEGTLYSSLSVDGAFFRVTGAGSPHTVPAPGGARFFIAR